jgi:dihydrofolate reductase
MKEITSFIHVTLDGFFAGPNGEIDWFKGIKKDAEWEEHTRKQSQQGSTLLMGHTTYEIMKSFWPTPAAATSDPHMAKVMRESPKVVVSSKLPSAADEPNWKNVKILRDLNPQEIGKLKETSRSLTILGSGTIVKQLTNLKLIDEYEIVLVPIILAAGKYLLKDVKTMEMKLLESRAFRNGLVFLRYRPA